MITVTFVRHGESTDNLKHIWAGWKDAPLSNHGMNQANAVGAAFAELPLTSIYTSPLKRAHSTAEAIHSHQKGTPHPPLIVNPDLREQNFGAAEGNPWTPASSGPPLKLDVQQKIFPVIANRTDKFPDGESLDDLGSRAAKAINEIVVPAVIQARGKPSVGEGAVHLVLVSHGLCISEMVGYLSRRGGNTSGARQFVGLQNTAWHRLIVGLPDEDAVLPVEQDPLTVPLSVTVVKTGNFDHLAHVKRQGGGIGSLAHDPKQQSLKAFFGGGGIPPQETGATVSQVDP